VAWEVPADVAADVAEVAVVVTDAADTVAAEAAGTS